MKRFYVLGLFLTMLLCCGMNASAAFNATIKWNIPGSIKIQTSTSSSSQISLAEDQTSYTVSSNFAFGRAYVYPNDGYVIEKAVATLADGKTVDMPAPSGYTTWWIGQINDTYNNSTIEITAKAEDGGGEEPGPGEDPEVKEYTLNVQMPEGFEDCFYSIYDMTAKKFVNIEDNKLLVAKDSQIKFNFNSGYNFEGFKLNGTDITSSFVAASGLTKANITVTVTEENSTFEILGKAVVYADIDLTAYIENPEGVIMANTYGGENFFNAADGTSVSSDINLAGSNGIEAYTMSAADTKQYTITINEKSPKIFFEAKEGYFIYTVRAKEGSSMDEITSIFYPNNASDKKFYVVAKKLDEAYKMNFSIQGTGAFKLEQNQANVGNWNTAGKYNVKGGAEFVDNIVEFFPNYTIPFSFRSLTQVLNMEVYVDGLPVSPDENNLYSVEPAYPSTDTKMSVATVYADGTHQGSKAAVKVTTNNGAKAEVFYSPMRRVAPDSIFTKGQPFLNKTEIAIKPASDKSYVIVNGKIVQGINAEGIFISDASGEYVFNASSRYTPNTVIVGNYETIEISADPAAGSTKKSISNFNILIPSNGETMYYTSFDLISKISFKAEGGEAIGISEIGEMSMNDEGTAQIIPIILAEPASVAGTYILDIPEGTFFEAAYNESSDATEAVAGGKISKAYSGEYIIDPSAKTPLDIYTITPAPGSAVKSIDKLFLNFTTLSVSDMVQTSQMQYAIISNGSDEYDVLFERYYDAEDCGFILTFTDANGEDVTVSTDGEWTLDIPAKMFSFNGNESEAIEAVYNINSNNPAYPLTPVPGEITGDLSNIIILFPGATDVEYKDVAITLKGVENDYSSSTVYVSATNADKNEFKIEFENAPILEGKYTVNIPAGAFIVNGEPSEEVTATFDYKPIWKLTPAPGSKVESLDELTLEFPDATEVVYEGSFNIMITNGGSYATYYSCSQVEGAGHPTFKLALNPEAQRPPMGTLSFVIDEGSFIVDGKPLGEISTSYVLEHEVSIEYIADPADDIVISEYGYTWAFIFADDVTIANFDASKAKVSLDGVELKPDADYMYMVENNMLMMGAMNTDFFKPGLLKVEMEAGAFTISGESSPAIEHTWNVVANKTYSYSVSPASGQTVSSLSKITISFPEAKSAEVWTTSWISFSKQNDYTFFQIDVVEVENAEVPTFDIIIKNVTDVTDGKYILEIQEGAFTLDNSFSSPAISAIYTVDATSTGIEGIGIDANNGVTVVTIDGKVIMKDADKKQLNELSNGLYIINGVKVLIKK